MIEDIRFGIHATVTLPAATFLILRHVHVVTTNTRYPRIQAISVPYVIEQYSVAITIPIYKESVSSACLLNSDILNALALSPVA